MSPAILDIAKSIHESIPAEHKPAFTDTIYEPVGCEQCNKTGYRGRLGIYEAITTTPEIEAIVQDNPSEREIKKVAADAGMMDMSQDGLIKILAGMTDWEEVARTVDMEKREAKMEETHTT